jgi:phosphatidylglycerophosphatase A
VNSSNNFAGGNPPEESSARIPFLPKLIATGLYSGYIPYISGTFGTLVGLLFYLIPGAEQPRVLGLMIVLGFFIGVWAAARVAAVVGHQLTKSAEMAKQIFQQGDHAVADPSIVVIDEIVGMWITLIFLPKTLPVIVFGFLAFRAFDILKPQPARNLERVPNGWGIMLDDVIAGIYANIATQIIWYASLRWGLV